MNTDPSTLGANHNPGDPSTGTPSTSERGKRNGFVGRARATAGALPSQIDDQIKRNPYFAIGIAAALGAGVGVVLSSRVLRAVLTTVAVTAAAEVTRAYFRKNAWVKAAI
jgi:hypothetical protein